jgi:hypothetical protein
VSDKMVKEEVPGVGDVLAREGTSTAMLIGAVSFWSKKSKSSWRDGFLSATIFYACLTIAGVIVTHYLG